MYSLILVIKVKVGQVISVVPFPTKHENDQETCLKVEKFCCEFIEPDEKKRKNFDDYFEFEKVIIVGIVPIRSMICHCML